MKRLRGPLRKRKSHLWKRHAHDFYVEPSWVSERLFEAEAFAPLWDPACGSGRIVAAARLHGVLARGTDIVRRSEYCAKTKDFFAYRATSRDIVSNPPFALAEAFAKHALKLAARSFSKVALLLPATWVQGARRSRWLSTTALVAVYFICPRPSMPPGNTTAKPGNGTTDYAWFVWDTAQQRRRAPVIRWLYRDAA